MLYGSDDRSAFDYPLIAYYLESDEHKIMVDTGGSVPKEGTWQQPYVRRPEEEIDAALAAIGVLPDTIDTVLFTHLHWDHAQNNHFFKHARFVAQQKEIDAYIAAEDKGYEKEEFGNTRYDSVEGDVDILSGIRGLLVPGHSKGSQAFLVDTPDGKSLLTGDLVPRYVNWDSNPKIPNGGHDDYEAMIASYRKLTEVSAQYDITRIYPGHEPKVFDLLSR
jgi:glyoxylase-like metal-dependent hydrolase (beta-lactamase superfamily II)